MTTAPEAQSNLKTALSLAGIVAGMVMLSYAAVPLYKIFCQVTGFGGTTQRAETLPESMVAGKEITVTFNADIDPNLPWIFRPLERNKKIRTGENILTAYEAENTSATAVSGMATYNVTPHEAGPYFHKVYCFCFEEQLLLPTQKINMPVSFYIDPAIEEDPNLKGIKNITLSYTFFSESSKNQ